MQDFLKDRLKSDLITRATDAEAQVRSEGFVAALDLFKDIQIKLEELCTRHFAEWERTYELANAVGVTTETRRQLSEARDKSAREEWTRHQAWEEATYLGVLSALGFGEPGDTKKLRPTPQRFANGLIELHKSWSELCETP